MVEMYWITRLNNICLFFGIMFWLSISAFIISWIVIWVNDDPDYRSEVNARKTAKKVVKYSVFFFFISGVIGVFVPSEKEMYKIIGIGATYEYLKSNDTAKQLPDKAIQCLDKLLTIDEKDDAEAIQ